MVPINALRLEVSLSTVRQCDNVADESKPVKFGSAPHLGERLRRRRLAVGLQEFDPALKSMAVDQIADMIVTPEFLVESIRAARADRSRVWAWQQSQKYQTEPWFGPGCTLVNSLDNRSTYMANAIAKTSRQTNGMLGGKPKKPAI